ncbi:MAG: DNA methyltransferase [Erythrobacter sp. SCN 68-10]|nr:MAG: DNA methyltransferase [Erythrobacter sp. SCN 68-10]
MTPTRPALRWHGGKWLLAPWIISQFPAHRIYVEPFGGAWSVGMRKPRCYAEIWNDLDGELVNYFTVLRDPRQAAELTSALRLTPFAREEFNRAYEVTEDPLERARRLVIRAFMGHGSDGASGQYRTGFRATSNRSGTTPAHDWANLPDCLDLVAKRVTGVVIESRPAIEVMAKHDGPETLHYVDPPYLPETRARCNRRADNGGVYLHELTTEQHVELLDFLDSLTGMVVLSGYPSTIYDQRLEHWHRVERSALKDGAAPATEVLWINPAAWAGLNRDLFAAEPA